MIDWRRFDAVSFDLYGTILDWEPEIAGFLSDWTEGHGLSVRGTDLLAAYDRLRQPLQLERPALPYPEILARTLEAMGREFGVPVSDVMRVRFSSIAGTHRPFQDSVAALCDLRRMGFRLAVLSNVDEVSFARVARAAGLDFDVVVTAERVGAYKPDPAHFHAALADLRALGIPKERVLHVAQSRRADIVPANALGLASVWIDRPGHVFGREGSGAENARPDFVAASLADLVRMLPAG